MACYGNRGSPICCLLFYLIPFLFFPFFFLEEDKWDSSKSFIGQGYSVM